MKRELGKPGSDSRPGDTYDHPHLGLFVAAAKVTAIRVKRCEGCSRRMKTLADAATCFELPECTRVVWVQDTPEGRHHYALALLES